MKMKLNFDFKQLIDSISKFAFDNAFPIIFISILFLIFAGFTSIANNKKEKANITENIRKCDDYELMHNNIRTRWLEGYKYCINRDTKERIQL